MLQSPLWKLRMECAILDRSQLNSIVDEWNDLARRSADDNAYYTPSYAMPLLRNILPAQDVRFATIRLHGRLVAFMPFVVSGRVAALFYGPSSAWSSVYTFTCTPLLDRDCPNDAAAALIDLLSTVHQGEWKIPAINIKGAAGGALVTALTRLGAPWAHEFAFNRATLRPTRSFDDHMRETVSPKRRKDLERNRRRLEKVGTVEHKVFKTGDGLRSAIESFLALEARGWKGENGTALACHQNTAEFARQAFNDGANSDSRRADVLFLNGIPIAVNLTIIAGKTGFTAKCAYDENYSSYSPGLLLEVEFLRQYLAEKWADQIDGGTAGNHVIDGLWGGYTEVADLVFSLAMVNASRRLGRLQTIDSMKQRLKIQVKELVERAQTGIDLVKHVASPPLQPEANRPSFPDAKRSNAAQAGQVRQDCVKISIPHQPRPAPERHARGGG